jgi:hypothetical protein
MQTMATVRLQDLTATIHNTSRFNGGKFDMVHVENLIQTDTPIDPTQCWYVPAGITPNPIAELLFRSQNMSMYPRSEADLLAGTQDIFEEAKSGKVPELTEDMSKLMMLSMLKKTPLTPVADTTNLYLLSYDYKIFPDLTNPSIFKFVSELPFKGLDVAPNGGTVQLAVNMPLGSVIDEAATIGTLPNGQQIQEQIVTIPNINRKVVTFRYNIDPLFNIVYHY